VRPFDRFSGASRAFVLSSSESGLGGMGDGFSIKVIGGRGEAPAPIAPAARPDSPEVGHDGRSRPIRIERDLVVEDRYHRLRLIQWWDQKKLADAVIVVGGAGALGNEVVKNLALLGVGRLLVCDKDSIETSNLTRSVLFRLSDVGSHKAVVACKRAGEINPDTVAIPIDGDLRFTLGLGLIRRSHAVMGCLDSVAARVYLNRHAFRMGKVFVDAGLDHLNGDVRTYALPEGPCYECGLSEKDRTELKRRSSCLKLTREDVARGHVPTAPTIAAMAGGKQVEVAIRAIHGRPIPAGRRLGWYGLSDVTFDTKLELNEECTTHGWMESLKDREVVETPLRARENSLADVLALVRKELGEPAYLTLEDDREVIVGLGCGQCDRTRRVLALAGTLAEKDALCEGCNQPMRPDLRARLDGSEGIAERSLYDIGIPPLHILRARNDETGREMLVELSGDVADYFGKNSQKA
jgi:adenylyltransferase/sulfurtransferase